MHTSFSNHSGFKHFFHGVECLGLLLLYFPDLTEATTTNDILKCEVRFADLYINEDG